MTNGLCTLAAVAALVALPLAAHAADESEIDAFSVARGHGSLLPIAADAVHFVGAVQGGFYVQGEEGPLRAGQLACTISLEVNTERRAQGGQGHCTMTADEGGSVFGEWQCQGHFLTGCSGPFRITGGTDRFKGATGEGPVTFRSAVGRLAMSPRDPSGRVELEGIVFWQKLKFRTP